MVHSPTLPAWLTDWLSGAGAKLRQNRLWQRMLKHSAAVTVALIIVFIPAVSARYGPATIFLAPMTTVFGHAGQRFGQMAESLVMVICGLALGLGWAFLGIYLSSLIFHTNQSGAYTVRAVFTVIAVIIHGYVRSRSPRLFLVAFVALIVCFMILMGTAHTVTVAMLTQIVYPMLTAMGVLLVVNVTIFPEFSGRFLGETTIDALSQTETTLKAAVEWFTEPIPWSEARKGNENSTAASTSAPLDGQNGERQQVASEEPSEVPSQKQTRVSRLATLTAAKGRLRLKMGSCKKVYEECTFEIMYSVLPPRSLKPISKEAMAGLVQNVITLISACESKFALVGEHTGDAPSGTSESDTDSDSSGSDSDGSSQSGHSDHVSREARSKASRRERKIMRDRQALVDMLKELKPHREIAAGDVDVLESLTSRVREPVAGLMVHVSDAIDLVMTCLAHCYDVQRLPSGAVVPKGIRIEELDIRVDIFTTAIASFDKSSTEALARTASVATEDGEVDIMPRIETFVMSSFLLSLRQAAEQTMQMLKHARVLLQRRQARNERRRIHLPRRINWRKWLLSGGEQDVMALPEDARKDMRTGKDAKKVTGTSKDESDDEDGLLTDLSDSRFVLSHRRDTEAAARALEKKSPPQPPRRRVGSKKRVSELSIFSRARVQLANLVESVMHSEHLAYALKLAVAVVLVTWPAFYGPFNTWYATSRASWAPLQLVLVFEVAIGSSFWIIMVRAGGVVFGCLWGFVAYKISHGNLVALVILLAVGVIPSTYVQLGTPYVKAGMISIVSMSVVGLAIINSTGPSWEIFLRRLAAFSVGGAVAILVEMVLYPVRARDRLIESLSSCISQIGQMEATIAAGVENPNKVAEVRSTRSALRFNKAKEKAQNALRAAETVLPFCLTEPRLKGSFKILEPIYREIIYVLHQIIDRMDNMMMLRQAYKSTVLEELNPRIYSYRRNLAASITLTLFAVNEALITRLPLPQFLPSSRLAQYRLVNRVREIIQSQPSLAGEVITASSERRGSRPTLSRANSQVIRSASQQTFLSWNATAAGQMEIIEYLEELVDLAKLLIGVNAFRSGMLDRPTYQNYVERLHMREKPAPQLFPFAGTVGDEDPGAPTPMSPVSSAPAAVRRRRTPSMAGLGLERSLSAFRDTVGRRMRSNTETRQRSQGAAETEDQLPVSLQRVGTRIRQERRIARRMTLPSN